MEKKTGFERWHSEIPFQARPSSAIIKIHTWKIDAPQNMTLDLPLDHDASFDNIKLSRFSSLSG